VQWFLSVANWEERHVQAVRLNLLREDSSPAPNGNGVLIIEETGDCKDRYQTARVHWQDLATVGKIDHCVVSVTSL
jgi:SRSO17 transposase